MRASSAGMYEVSGVRWLPLRQEEYWTLYSMVSQIAESNLLYSTVLEELNSLVLKAEQA